MFEVHREGGGGDPERAPLRLLREAQDFHRDQFDTVVINDTGFVNVAACVFVQPEGEEEVELIVRARILFVRLFTGGS